MASPPPPDNPHHLSSVGSNHRSPSPSRQFLSSSPKPSSLLVTTLRRTSTPRTTARPTFDSHSSFEGRQTPPTAAVDNMSNLVGSGHSAASSANLKSPVIGAASPVPNYGDDEDEVAAEAADDTAEMPLTMAASVVLTNLPGDAREALREAIAGRGGIMGSTSGVVGAVGMSVPEKVTIRFNSLGSAPQLKQKVAKLSSTAAFSTVTKFLRKKLGLKPTDPIHCYIGQAFEPAFDEEVGGLWKTAKNQDIDIANNPDADRIDEMSAIAFKLAIALQGGTSIYKGLGSSGTDAVGITGFSWNASDVNTGGHITFGPLTIFKTVDAGSPTLFQVLAADQKIVTVTLSSQDGTSSGSTNEISYLFSDANLLSVTHAITGPNMMETLKLNFKSMDLAATTNTQTHRAGIKSGENPGNPLKDSVSSALTVSMPSSAPTVSDVAKESKLSKMESSKIVGSKVKKSTSSAIVKEVKSSMKTSKVEAKATVTPGFSSVALSAKISAKASASVKASKSA